MDYGFEIVGQDTAYRGFFRLERYRIRHQRFAGGEPMTVTRECLERGHAVAVLPYDPARDQIVLIEQFRVGGMAFPEGPWLLEIVAGILDHPGESPEEVARREAVEEAGCVVEDLVPICHYLVSPGGTSETIALFCGRVDAATVTPEIRGVAAEGEDIRLHVVSRAEAFALLADGKICSAAPIIALQWLGLHREALLQRWGCADEENSAVQVKC